MRGISWVAAQLAASQQGISSVSESENVRNLLFITQQYQLNCWLRSFGRFALMRQQYQLNYWLCSFGRFALMRQQNQLNYWLRSSGPFAVMRNSTRSPTGFAAPDRLHSCATVPAHLLATQLPTLCTHAQQYPLTYWLRSSGRFALMRNSTSSPTGLAAPNGLHSCATLPAHLLALQLRTVCTHAQHYPLTYWLGSSGRF
jgi:hypothetical protein